ncbi:hypothetical protein K0U07_03910 [bacterium]|nr:hypothetical protein [bacterium]
MSLWKKIIPTLLLSYLPLYSQTTHYHGVNLCNGKLEYTTEDMVVESGAPIPISRGCYVLEKAPAKDKFYQSLEQIGLFPYLKLYLHKNSSGYYGEVIETSGRTLYKEAKHPKNRLVMERDLGKSPFYSAASSYRENPINDKLTFVRNDKDATLELADGTKRYYKKHGKKTTWKDTVAGYYRKLGYQYRLIKEVAPSGEVTLFEYKKNKSVLIKKVNPHNENVISWIRITLEAGQNHYLKVETSDQKVLYYHLTYLGDKRNALYLASLKKPGCKTLSFSYTKAKQKEAFYSTKAHTRDGSYSITYDFTNNENKEAVKELYKHGQKIASFCFDEGVTTVTDFRGAITKYFHAENKITKIEQYTKENRLYCLEKYDWEAHKIVSKTLFDGYGKRLLSSLFTYDNHGNLLKKEWSNEKESYVETYSYNDNHLVTQKNDNGVITNYRYKEGTTLLAHKKIGDIEEVNQYDENGLLTSARCRWNNGKTERAKTFYRDPQTKLITKKTDGPLSTIYTYDRSCKLVQEQKGNAITSYAYDSAGRLIEQQLPLGGINKYEYDENGKILGKKEIGKPYKEYHYYPDTLTQTIVIHGKESTKQFDLQGKILEEINEYGFSTTFTYDEFGRLVKKILPEQEISGNLVRPEWSYEYDVFGNRIKEVSPSQQIIKTSYNLLGKPTKILYPDGTNITHKYDRHGNVIATSLKDNSKIFYEYDDLGRTISKKQGSFEEKWEYLGYDLTKYTNKRGLSTKYYYDEFGRKEAEDYAGRIKLFAYNNQGNCYRIEEGALVEEKTYDMEGKVIDSAHNGFDYTKNEYNEENQKVRTLKTTSQGEAEDLYVYDEQGRLTMHSNPLQEETVYLFEDQKETIFYPSGKKVEKRFDPEGRITEETHTLPNGTSTTSKTYYDIDGRIFKQSIADHTIEYVYNKMGLMTEKTERGETTKFIYDKKGRCNKKILPNEISILYQYDPQDRKISMESSDNSVSYQYFYEGEDLVQIKDILTNKSLYFEYSKFGELEKETSLHGFTTSWSYDTFGRKKALHLPDGSSIHYQYEKNCLVKVSRKNSKSQKLYSHEYSKFDQAKQVMQEILPLGLGTTSTEHDILERPIKLLSPFHKIEVCFDKDNTPKQQSTLHLEMEQEKQEDNPDNIISKKTYDALERLVFIQYENGNYTSFEYDPLSRLISKETPEGISHFLYDGETEIAIVDENGEIERLKVFGLDEHGKIGAAISIELDGQTLIPLYDLQGNIVALVDNNGHVQEVGSYIKSIENF